jgi:hypothetical protein
MQPWAWAVFNGKDIENRKRRFHYRGPLLIHASKRYDWNGHRRLEEMGYSVPKNLPRGVILGQVDLVDCKPAADLPPNQWKQDGAMCLVLRNPVPAKSLQPCRGQLGIFDVMKQQELIG